MLRKLRGTHFVIIVIILLMSIVLVSGLLAQDSEAPVETATPTPTVTQVPTSTPTPTMTPTATPTATLMPSATPTEEIPQITVLSIQPSELSQSTGGTLTIIGANFTNNTTASLNGTIALGTTAQTADTLTVSIGTDVPAGVYTVQVSDPVGGNASASSALTIMAATATVTPQLVVTHNEPSKVTSGESVSLSVLGANFTENTTVRLIGYGFLQTTFINSGALTALLPSTVPAGRYDVEISDPTNGTVTAPNTLRVQSAVTETPEPTAIPGQPSLTVSGFVAAPSSIYPGGTTQITLQVVNVGDRTAEGVIVSLGDSTFVPANGQASLTLPDLSPSETYTVVLAITAPTDATAGPASIPLELSSYDFSGTMYNDSAHLSVTILEEAERQSQVVLDSYRVTPDSALPGDTVTLQALFTNTGNETASQVLVQLDASNGVLIAGGNGNSVAIGDILPGASVPVEMPLVVANDASAGVQAQSFNVTYLQDGETQQTTASISLNIEVKIDSSPLLLLQSYGTGQDEALQPGQQFVYEMTLQNAGDADASNLLLTFGTVSSSDDTTSSTSASTSTNFSPLGGGNTQFLNALAAGQNLTVNQEFIVSNSLSSGVYDLPITLQYQLADGTTTKQSLDASLIVIVPPRLRITLSNTLDDPLTSGESYSLSIKVANLGSSKVALTEMRVTGENVTVSEGEETILDPLQTDDDTTVSATIEPVEEGTYTVVVEVDYIDDLNRTQTYTTTFTGNVTAPVVQDRRPPVRPVTETQEEENLAGRLLLGFLGLGG
ncbi:MAG: hypothetical protein K8L99_34080 [Anaerolineae bacterium]|nr:hypothetical protein [Anaerolineae bacterium]